MTLSHWLQVDTGDFNFTGYGRPDQPQLAPEPLPDDWRGWLKALFPHYFSSTFAQRQIDFWEWVWGITPTWHPDPFFGIWPRGGGKSTSVEAAVVTLGARAIRNYIWYVRETQDQADQSVENIGGLLEGPEIAQHYPDSAQRMVGKYGTSRGWRRNRLRTAADWTVDALGLDKAIRGTKVEERRPDLIVLDDLDGLYDTERTTQKKIDILTKSILPAGQTGKTTVIGIQNLINPDGIFSQISDGRASFLLPRQVSGPHPAVKDLEYGWKEQDDGTRYPVITGGTPTWQGQDLEACQALMQLIGPLAFIQECQHEVQEREGALWSKALIEKDRVQVLPPLKRVALGIDPSGGTADIGIMGAGIGYDNHAYVFADDTQPGSKGPRNWALKTINRYSDPDNLADAVVAEKNYGGDLVKRNIHAEDPTVNVIMVSATRGKAVRAEPVVSEYERGKVHHVGYFPKLEREMTWWIPGEPSPNRLDALVWVLTYLLLMPRTSVYGGSR